MFLLYWVLVWEFVEEKPGCVPCGYPLWLGSKRNAQGTNSFWASPMLRQPSSEQVETNAKPKVVATCVCCAIEPVLGVCLSCFEGALF